MVVRTIDARWIRFDRHATAHSAFQDDSILQDNKMVKVLILIRSIERQELG